MFGFKKLLCLCCLSMCFMCLCGFTNLESASEIRKDNGSNIYFTGDSRTYLGYTTVRDDRVNWLAAGGAKYAYFRDNYMPILEQVDKKGKTIVIFFGVNDVMEDKNLALQNWLSFLTTTAHRWAFEGARIIICSVPGIDYGMCAIDPNLTKESVDMCNQTINEYNELMRSSLPIDVEWMEIKKMYPFADGIHYMPEDSFQIYEGVINRVISTGSK